MKKYLSFLSFIVVFVIAGCSGGSKNNQDNAAQTGNQENEQATTVTSGSRTIDIYGIDNMKYVVAEKKDNLQTGKQMKVKGNTYYLLKGITADAGQKFTINLKNISDLPPSAMSHNWCLLKMDADPAAFAQAGASNKQNDYIAPEMKDEVIKETGMVGGGESKSITFSIPQKTGDYTYVCTFPGHFSSGMKGTLTVQ